MSHPTPHPTPHHTHTQLFIVCPFILGNNSEFSTRTDQFFNFSVPIEIDGVPGSVSQIRESVASITSHAKARNLPVFLVGHITKEEYELAKKLRAHIKIK